MMTDRRCAGTEPLLSAWLDGALSRAERVRVRAHLRRCEACGRELDGLAQVRALVRSAPVHALPGGVLDPAAVPVGRRRRRRAGLRLAARVAAAGALAGGALGVAAFTLGAPPAPARVVSVPVDVFAADHLVRSVSGPVTMPVLLEGR
jgi:anti-sigma factor RsiW